MKKINILGIALVAMCAVSAVTAASASAALPEFKVTSFPVSFTSESVLPLEPTFHGNALGVNVNIECKMSKDTGEMSTAKSVGKILITFTECRVGTAACTTSGQASGVVRTKFIRAQLGYVEGRTAKESGMELRPESGTTFAEFTCTGLPAAVVSGCTIGEGLPINVSQLTGDLLFEENIAKTAQRWTKLEGEAACTLTVFAKAAWLMDRERETFTKNVELKA